MRGLILLVRGHHLRFVDAELLRLLLLRLRLVAHLGPRLARESGREALLARRHLRRVVDSLRLQAGILVLRDHRTLLRDLGLGLGHLFDLLLHDANLQDTSELQMSEEVAT